MSPEEISMDARQVLAQAEEIVARIEDQDPAHPMANSALCFSAQQAAELALKAVCLFYDQPAPDTHDLGAMIDILHPTLMRVPVQVQKARSLSEYADGAGATGQAEPATSDECQEAVTLAQNVVGWAQVILRAGKTVTPGRGEVS